MFTKLRLWKLRIHAACTMLFDKDFYRKLRAYKKLDKYIKLIDILSKGSLLSRNIQIEDCNMKGQRLFLCNLDYISYNEEACFDLRRLCYSIPHGYFNGKEVEELELVK